jgi:predicted NBD/HSP70 family sugar kinase
VLAVQGAGAIVDEPKRQGQAAEMAASWPVDLGRGTNQTAVRLYNERLVLSLVRRRGSLSKAEIARLTGLSAQTISVIMRQLETDGLLRKEAPLRGRVGQPSVPFSLAPEGAFFLGLKVGRRSSDLVLMDFAGEVRRALHETYPYPTPAGVLAFTRRGTEAIVAGLPPQSRERIAGLGIAAPFELWNWAEQVGAPADVLDGWRAFDIASEIGRACAWPVFFCNDATAACAAELVLGNPQHAADFLYVFVGMFVGGGVVLNGSLMPGRTGNAGALGSMPIVATGRARTVPQQLIGTASIHGLEERLIAAGGDATVLWRSPEDWGDVGALLDGWIEEVARSLALAAAAAVSVIDFEAVIVDGAFPATVRTGIVERTTAHMARLDRRGLSPVALIEGTIGAPARAIGGACLPLLAGYSRDREVLFKESG